MAQHLLVRKKFAITPRQVRLLRCSFVLLDQWRLADLSAPYWRLYWHDRTGGSVSMAGKWVPLGPEEIVLIPPGTDYASHSTRPFGQVYVHFSTESRYTGSLSDAIIRPVRSEHRALIEQLVQGLSQPEKNEPVRLSSCSHALVHLVLSTVPETMWRRRPNDPRINAAVDRIHAHYPSHLPNTTLAELAGMHPNAFIRLFREAIGQTPSQYLLHLRIDEAGALLHHSAHGIDEIAERTGFYDRFHFSRAFKKIIGSTPAQFRKNTLSSASPP